MFEFEELNMARTYTNGFNGEEFCPLKHGCHFSTAAAISGYLEIFMGPHLAIAVTGSSTLLTKSKGFFVFPPNGPDNHQQAGKADVDICQSLTSISIVGNNLPWDTHQRVVNIT
jgi:hypothetical protein